MKYLVHSVYRYGGSGLSNLSMSVELGVILASLTNRVLILKGNAPPLGNLVSYDNLVSNDRLSRVTDLMDPGVSWLDGNEMDIASLAPKEICDQPAWESVFYLPNNLQTDSRSFRAFAKNRRNFFTVDDELQSAPALSVSCGVDGNTLSYYAPFFYVEGAHRQRMFDALRGVAPKPHLSALADQVTRDLGTFNAVHIRRGDFKRSIGANTRDRTGAEAVEAMDRHFGRDKLLVILTDEADDSFFDEIKSAYRDVVFVDWHILREYGALFNDLPTNDSLALAYISQLIGAQSDDFIGTLNSTYTGIIQRLRGNRGKDEKFKYLWSPLPAKENSVEQHPEGSPNCVRLDQGIMVEDGIGPYTWNRVDQRLNTAWMREWPEAFTHEAAISRSAAARTNFEAESETVASHSLNFMDHAVSVGSNDPDVDGAIARLFFLMLGPRADEPIARVTLEILGQQLHLILNGTVKHSRGNDARLLRDLYREVVRQFIHKYPSWTWLHASCAASEHGAVILPGSWGRGKSTLALQLFKEGWRFLSDDVVPLNPASGAAIPFPATPQVRPGAEQALPRDQLSRLGKVGVSIEAARVASAPTKVSMIVFPRFESNADTSLELITPGQSVCTLLENCLSFPENSDKTIRQLCAMVEGLPSYTLLFSDPADAAAILADEQRSMSPSYGTVGYGSLERGVL